VGELGGDADYREILRREGIPLPPLWMRKNHPPSPLLRMTLHPWRMILQRGYFPQTLVL
jgi:hypothetical protein